jgi:alpha-ribazole phosphatase
MCLGTCPGGESRAEFSERACSAFLSILDMEHLDMERKITPEKKRESNSEDLIVVSHGGTQMAILERWGRPARDYYDWQRPCGCGWKLSLKESENTASMPDQPAAAEHDAIELFVQEGVCFIHQ